MNGQPLECVVDASVGVKLFVAEPLSDRANALFDHLTADPPGRLYVPDLFFAECANILWKYARRFAYPAANARQDLADLQALALRNVSTADLVVEAFEIALPHVITAYDACYVALADRLHVPLITADEVLVRKLAGTLYAVHWLADFPVPPLSPP